MGGYSKTIIAPIVALIALVLGSFRVTIDEGTQSQIVDSLVTLVTAGISVYGIIKNHKK